MRITELPGPRGVPLVGNALELRPDRLHLVLEAWCRAHGPVFRVRAGTRRMVVVADAKLQGEVLRARPDTYRRVRTIETLLTELGIEGVFSAEGAAWKPQRKLAMEALAPKNLRTFYPSLVQVADRLRTRWTAAARSGRTLDLLDEFRRVTVDVTTRLVFGHDLNTLGSEQKDPLSLLLEPLFPALNRRLSALVPYWRFVRLPADRALDSTMQRLFVWVQARVQQARDALTAHPERTEHPTNFLEAMLVAKDDRGVGFSDTVITGNALTMLVAGEDTTANTLAWAVHHLSDDPRVQDELRHEAASLFVDGAPPDLEAAGALLYAGAVAQETMRLRPVAPLLFLEPTRDVVLGELDLPQGTTVILLTRAPAVRDDVMDADRFVPERWLQATPAARRFDTALAIPFGSGPRICPGRSLALLEMRVVLATLYQHFDIERAVPRDAVREHFAFSMTPTQLPARVRLRG